MNQNFLLIQPEIKDSEMIYHLQRKNLYSLLTVEQRNKNGFVRIELSQTEISEIIKSEMIVVAKLNNNIVGYYLLASGCNTEKSYNYLKKECDTLTYKGKIITEYRVAYGTQACVDINFRGNNLGTLLFHKILNLLHKRYDILLGSITKENHKGFELSTKRISGITIKETKERSFILFDIENLIELI